MSEDTTIIGSVKFTKLDDHLKKIDQIAFELTDKSVNSFNNAFSGNTCIHVLSSSHKDNHDRNVFDDIPYIKIVKDPKTDTYVFETAEADHDIKWMSPDGLFSFMLLDNKYLKATLHGMGLLFMIDIQDYETVYGSLISTLISLDINDIFINLDK